MPLYATSANCAVNIIENIILEQTGDRSENERKSTLRNWFRRNMETISVDLRNFLTAYIVSRSPINADKQ
jgi:hypothetical protein